MYSKFIYLSLFIICKISTFSQIEIFKTNLKLTENDLSSFISSINKDEKSIYFIANNYKLYCFENNVNTIKYCKDIDCKTNDPVYILNDTLITSLYSNNIKAPVFLNKNTGQILQKLDLKPLKSKPYFINDSVFISTQINDGGELFSYNIKSNKTIWNHFVGHGAFKEIYFKKDFILANFDYDEWKTLSYNGNIIEKNEEIESKKKTNINPKFYTLSHDEKEITQTIIDKYNLRSENLKVKRNQKTTVLLSSNKIIILANNLKLKTDFEFKNSVKLPDNGENDYLEILKLEKENVWFFYQNLLINYNFSKNHINKTYDLTKWNAHQIILDETTLLLISKNDGELYSIEIEK